MACASDFLVRATLGFDKVESTIRELLRLRYAQFKPSFEASPQLMCTTWPRFTSTLRKVSTSPIALCADVCQAGEEFATMLCKPGGRIPIARSLYSDTHMDVGRGFMCSLDDLLLTKVLCCSGVTLIGVPDVRAIHPAGRRFER